MLKINLYRNNNSESVYFGKVYGRVENASPIGIDELAQHMSEHNTPYSKGIIKGILTDMAACIKELMLMGQPVKLADLAIFKATVEANGLDVLYDAQTDKVASATLGVLKEGDKTGAAVKTIKLLAQSTGDFTREELKKVVKFSWTDKAKAEIAAAKGDNAGSGGSGSGGGSSDGPSAEG